MRLAMLKGMSGHQIIYIRPDAPPKPAVGLPCNGCGVCCLAEPCPVGVLVSRRLKGACKMLHWSDEHARYLCGLLGAGDLVQSRPNSLLRRLWRRWAKRVIASGVGCDADIELG